MALAAIFNEREPTLESLDIAADCRLHRSNPFIMRRSPCTWKSAL